MLCSVQAVWDRAALHKVRQGWNGTQTATSSGSDAPAVHAACSMLGDGQRASSHGLHRVLVISPLLHPAVDVPCPQCCAGSARQAN